MFSSNIINTRWQWWVQMIAAYSPSQLAWSEGWHLLGTVLYLSNKLGDDMITAP